MIYLLNMLNSVNNSDAIFFLIIVLLILVIITMIYMIYSQKKDIKKVTEKVEEIPHVKDDVIESINSNVPNSDESFSDTQELMNITKELETLPKERKISLTPYEEEQEEKAIISYEELINAADKENSLYSDENNISLKEMNINNIEKTNEIKKDVLNEEVDSYEHEEQYLKALKQLRKILN